MKFLQWLRPGIKIKRWIALSIVGIVFISYGLSFFLREIYYSLQLYFLSVSLICAGTTFIYVSILYVMETFYSIVSNRGFKISLDSEKLGNLLFEKRILIKGPKFVVIGGGTGISTLLRGLKQYSSNITAIVTVSDDGGGSGMLRQDLGILPPGDIRNCILALADTEPIMQKLLQYRFEDGMLKGQSFGNLFLAAMDGISPNFEEAVKKVSDVLAVTGKVLPVTLNDVRLVAEMENGDEVQGEHNIGHHDYKEKGRIKMVKLVPENVQPLKEALEAILEADVIILGPGSLYTSIIPNLLVKGVSDAIKESNAIKLYICNLMTQPGETDYYSAGDHIRAIEEHSHKGIIKYCFVNDSAIPTQVEVRYKDEGASKVRIDRKTLQELNVKVTTGKFMTLFSDFYIRHDTDKLSEEIVQLLVDKILSSDKKRALDYYYIKERLKKNNIK